jgi:hypothetical protein
MDILATVLHYSAYPYSVAGSELRSVRRPGDRQGKGLVGCVPIKRSHLAFTSMVNSQKTVLTFSYQSQNVLAESLSGCVTRDDTHRMPFGILNVFSYGFFGWRWSDQGCMSSFLLPWLFMLIRLLLIYCCG